MPKDHQMTTATSPAAVLVHAEHLVQRGDAVFYYLEEVLGLDDGDIGLLFRAAGLGFQSHHLNDEACPYRAQLDLEIAGHTLSLADRIKDRSERLALIEDAIEKTQGADVEAAASYIQKERASRVTLENSPEYYRKSFEVMKQDLLGVLNVKGVKTTLGLEEIVRFFGMEESTFHANFAKIISELREEHGIDGAAIHHPEEGVVAYRFELMV